MCDNATHTTKRPHCTSTHNNHKIVNIMSSRSIRLILLLVCTLQSCFSQFEQFGGGGPKMCPPYNKCAKDEEPVPKWPMKLTSTGCTKLGGGVSMASIGQFNDGLHSGCCDNWNACNQICGALRAQCDAIFDKCLDAVCDKISDEEEKKMCTSNASTKKLLLQLSDCRFYQESQNAGCECVKKTDVEEKRKGLLTNFYKKYNPNEVNKVENLASKSNDVKKLATLLIKLAAKYPKSVKRIKDKQEIMMEELLKRQRESEKSKPASEEKTTTTTESSSTSDEEDQVEERIEL